MILTYDKVNKVNYFKDLSLTRVICSQKVVFHENYMIQMLKK